MRWDDAKNFVNNHNKHHVLEPREEAEQKNTRQEFAEADRVFDRKTRNRLEG